MVRGNRRTKQYLINLLMLKKPPSAFRINSSFRSCYRFMMHTHRSNSQVKPEVVLECFATGHSDSQNVSKM